jgi:hypothetical protein
MGQKFNVRVVSNPQAYIDLAYTMEPFLEVVETILNWSVTQAQQPYNPPLDAFFKIPCICASLGHRLSSDAYGHHSSNTS